MEHHQTRLQQILKEHGLGETTPRGQKYKNKKVVVDGILFDSKREANRYGELKYLELAGEITGLTLQMSFTLAPPVVINGKKKQALKYVADFVYRKASGEYVVEDAKGVKTQGYIIKRHLMKSVHGIDVQEV